jgi:hypothetical protein
MRLVLYAVTIGIAVTVAYSQENRDVELPAQEILARVDLVLKYPTGLMKGTLRHITPQGQTTTNWFQGRISTEDFLFTFGSDRRGTEIRVLYNLGGEDIWVYNVLSLKLFHKIDIDRFNPVMGSNFTFTDLSNADFQSNYTAKITGTRAIRGEDGREYPVTILALDPIFKRGEYGLLTMYVTRDTFIPLRIHYHDQDKVVRKVLSVVRVGTSGSRSFPVRYDMLDVNTGSVSILNVDSIDETVSFPRRFFYHQSLAEAPECRSFSYHTGLPPATIS